MMNNLVWRKLVILMIHFHLIHQGKSFVMPTSHSSKSELSPLQASSQLTQPQEGQYWTWNGHDIYTKVQGDNKTKLPAVLLIHGFGCSTTYWRSTSMALQSAGYQVHAIDLLGQGRSAKPADVYYSINLWAKLIDDYAAENISSGNGVVLMGNSLGSLVALAAATGDHTQGGDTSLTNRVMGVCMYNCGVGLNSRNIIKDAQWNPLQRLLLNSLFDVLNVLIFNNRLLLSYVLENVVTKDLLRDTLQSLYKHDPSRVDDELVDSFYFPAKDAGAVDAFMQIYTNDAGSTPMELHEKYDEMLAEYGASGRPLPIHLVWGDDDAVTPLEGSVGQFYKKLAEDGTATGVSLDVVGSGHVPFDDNPVESNASMLKWVQGLGQGQTRDFVFPAFFDFSGLLSR